MDELYAAPELSVPTQMVFFLVAFAGLMLNLVVLFVVLLRRQTSHSSESILMMLVAGFDLVACAFSLLAEQLRIIGVLKIDNATYCYADLFLFSTSTFASLTMTCALSLVRYINVVWRRRISRVVAVGLSLLYLGFVWLVVVGRGVTSPLMLMPSGLYCMPYVQNPTGFGDFLETMYVVLFLPCPLVLMLSYALVTRHYYSVIKRNAQRSAAMALAKAELSVASALAHNSYVRAHLRNILELVLVVALYLASILPEFVMSICTLLAQTRRTNALDNYVFIAMFSLSVINPLFVLHLNSAANPNLPLTPSQ